MAFDSLKAKDCIKYVWGSDKSNEMLEKMKIEIALVYNWSVHDQYDTLLILYEMIKLFVFYDFWKLAKL